MTLAGLVPTAQAPHPQTPRYRWCYPALSWCPLFRNEWCPARLPVPTPPTRIVTVKKMHALGQLIMNVQRRNDWSDRDLQDRAERLKLTALSKSNFSRWRNSPVNSIKGSNIRDMAAVLGVSEGVVAKAALESMDIHVPTQESASIQSALSQDPSLSARDKRLIGVLLGAMSDTEEAAHEHDAEDQEQEPRAEARGQEPAQPSPMTRAGVSPAPEDDEDSVPPVPDEYALAAYDAPSEGRERRRVQDEAAEGSQETSEWGDA